MGEWGVDWWVKFDLSWFYEWLVEGLFVWLCISGLYFVGCLLDGCVDG